VKVRRKIVLYAVLAVFALQVGYACKGGVVVDSHLTRDGAIYSNQPPDVMSCVQENLAVLDVRYYGFDGQVHQGQVVVHEALAADIRQGFDVILKTRFPGGISFAHCPFPDSTQRPLWSFPGYE